MELYKKVAVIGLGSLGGFVCDNIVKIDSIKRVTIVDPDIVKEKNLKNSIYFKEDIGKLKVDALERILKRSKKNLKIKKVAERFLEGKTDIGKHDLVIDCRDFTYDRGNFIDTRLFISSKYLVVDCRKNIKYHKAYEGLYDLDVQKRDIIDAANFTASLLQKGLLTELIKKQLLYTVEVDYVDRVAKESLQRRNNKSDIIFDETVSQTKITNLLENIFQVIEMNKKNDLLVFLGNKKTPVVSKSIEKLSLSAPQEVVSCFSSMVKHPIISDTFYFIKLNPKNHSVEIIPETAAA